MDLAFDCVFVLCYLFYVNVMRSVFTWLWNNKAEVEVDCTFILT